MKKLPTLTDKSPVVLTEKRPLDPSNPARGDLIEHEVRRTGPGEFDIVRRRTASPGTAHRWATVEDGVVLRVSIGTEETTAERHARWSETGVPHRRIKVPEGAPVGPGWRFRDGKFFPIPAEEDESAAIDSTDPENPRRIQRWSEYIDGVACLPSGSASSSSSG